MPQDWKLQFEVHHHIRDRPYINIPDLLQPHLGPHRHLAGLYPMAEEEVVAQGGEVADPVVVAVGLPWVWAYEWVSVSQLL